MSSINYQNLFRFAIHKIFIRNIHKLVKVVLQKNKIYLNDIKPKIAFTQNLSLDR